MRVLGVVRLSRDREESTSVERQRAYIEQWATANGHSIVGWAEDLDVSGSVAPWQRPELGQWLPHTLNREASAETHAEAWARSKAGEWDVMVAWRLDRITRRVLHLHSLMEWATQNGKGIASTTEGDLNSGAGKMLVTILSALAEGELEAMRERARSSFQHLTLSVGGVAASCHTATRL